ncbi:DUF1524 domain-containing protein [Nannocystis sp. SCPEA4]|uniref:GmrSD restriction endonuclease domain-containing protein n=1 Tax=Nannocystis sp. SCPEA4 TaxID=2996787 RepID=UPI002271335F|nr:DUF1524 domain-containing protein [Nannocystis sp. SCPEA4]MCY1061453.1 DUF1524 domain-containing protein [Nannocystis sp. SCPEA4]
MQPGRVRLLVSCVVLSFAAASSGCIPGTGEQAIEAAPPSIVRPRDEPASQPASASRAGSRLAALLLATLAVRPRDAGKGYAREQFGHAWADVDKNGCDTRDDILRRDLHDVRLEPGKRPCVVTAGRLADPYTDKDIEFERGGGAQVDIDHVVALHDAWATGAAAWQPARRIALANDPLNLLAVAASANRAKGGGNAAVWLPPNPAYRCAYVARQIAVKAKYGLWITEDEHATMTEVLRDCPDEVAPEGTAPIDAPIEATAHAKPHARAERAAAPPQPAAEKPRGADPDYGTCKEAKAHGAGPYRRGVDPEYAYYRDADGDGVVCE